MATDLATAALIRKRAELAGEIEALDATLSQLRADLVHLDAAIRIMSPNVEPEAIRPKKPSRKGCDWFGRGELARLVLDTLREAAEPTPTREVAKGVMDRRGMPPGDRATFLLVEKRVDRYLRRQEGRLALGSRSVGWRIVR